MVFADGFWEVKNLNDSIAVVGLVLTLLSIWLAVYYAKRDLQRTIKVATAEARAALERFALELLHRELSEMSRRLREARDAIKRKEWPRAALRLDDAEAHVAAALEDPRLSDAEGELLRRVADDLTILSRSVGRLEIVRSEKSLPQSRLDSLDRMIRSTSLLDGRLRRRIMETDYVREDGGAPRTPPRPDSGGEGGVGVPRG